MAADLGTLIPEFRDKVLAALANLKSQGLIFVP